MYVTMLHATTAVEDLDYCNKLFLANFSRSPLSGQWLKNVPFECLQPAVYGAVRQVVLTQGRRVQH